MDSTGEYKTRKDIEDQLCGGIILGYGRHTSCML